jgi:hypothetical protein
LLIPGWLVFEFSAAKLMFNLLSTTARKYFNCVKVMVARIAVGQIKED